MARVECEVNYEEIEEGGRTGDGVVVTCGECGKSQQSFGTSERSVKRCLVLLKENCPLDESNYYVAPEIED